MQVQCQKTFVLQREVQVVASHRWGAVDRPGGQRFPQYFAIFFIDSYDFEIAAYVDDTVHNGGRRSSRHTQVIGTKEYAFEDWGGAGDIT